MAYDRYDNGPGRGDPRRSDHGDRSRREERGFFERAGDEISSWFGSDDDERGHRGDRNEHREHGRGWSAAEHGWGGDPRDVNYGRGRDFDRDDNRSRGEWRGSDRSRDDNEHGARNSARPMNWTSSNSDYRSGSGSSAGRDDSWFGGGDRDQGHRERGSFGGDSGYRPMTGDYGRSQSQWGRDDYRNTSQAGSSRNHDPHYSSWRQRQLDELDRDYDEYHRERQERFENDFGSWRQTRQQKRQMVSQAREHMDVVGSDGETLGKVDRIAGDRIILTKSDSPDGRHHSIPCTMVDKIEENRILLDCTAEDAQKKWSDDDGERALFERDDQGETGPHTLERSFSGTYKR